jgi:hypothetical protein
MILPKLPKKTVGRREMVAMRGINYADSHTDGDLAESRNLTTKRWPYMSVRSKRIKMPMGGTTEYSNVTAMTSWADSFVTVRGTGLWYGDELVGTVTAGSKQFAVVNTKLVIWPDKVYLDVENKTVVPLGAAVTTKATFTAGEITVSGIDLTASFKAGDTVTVSGASTLKGNNKDIYIKSLTATTITTNADSLEAGEDTVTITRRIPDLDFICESGNRLWGCSSSTKTIYASALGDPTNFFVYEGLSTDSYAVSVGSDGEFTGCCKLSSSVLFWKERTLHKMLGDYPAEYALYDYSVDGLRKGCHGSLVIINETLYYMGLHGIYVYRGGTPTGISASLGNHEMEYGVAGTDGEMLYLSAVDAGENRFYTYDPVKGMWVQEDNARATAFTRIGRYCYFLSDGAVWQADSGEVDTELEWAAQFTPFYETVEGRKMFSRILIRLQIGKGAWVKAEYRCDGGRWIEASKIIGATEDVAQIRIAPNRCDKFEIRLSGKGMCVIQNILREFSVGGAR